MRLALTPPTPSFLPGSRTPLLPTWLRASLLALAPQLALLVTSALLLYPALTAGAVQWEDDTKYFYYPFLADTFDPAWRAFVDGHEQPIHRANAMFRAVPLAAGEHRVEFRYQPVPLQRGAAISLLTGVGLLTLLLASLLSLVPLNPFQSRPHRDIPRG